LYYMSNGLMGKACGCHPIKHNLQEIGSFCPKGSISGEAQACIQRQLREKF
jgi:hypothetical protein